MEGIKNRSKYFTQLESSEKLIISSDMPIIREVKSVISDTKIVSKTIINTTEGLSIEGKKLTGKLVGIELNTKHKILYVADSERESIHMMEKEQYSIAYIVIPSLVEGTEITKLINSKYLKIEIAVEDTFVKKLDGNSVFLKYNLLVQLNIIQTHKLCYSLEKDSDISQIYLAYKDCTNIRQAKHIDSSKNIKPLWSPTGNKIAYISNAEGKFMLYILTLKDMSIDRITDLKRCNLVSSFCWTKDGNSIIFSSSYGQGKELFIIDIENKKCNQLTFGKTISKSYKPKISPDGKKIAFLRSITGITQLSIMDIDGTNCINIETKGHVKDFDWSIDNKNIAYIIRDSKRDRLGIINLANSKMQRKYVNTYGSIIEKRNVCFAPNGLSIGFIGTSLSTENIYLYSLVEDNLKNITQNFNNVLIDSFVWDIDSTNIYYSANDLYYYNIYSINLYNDKRNQLTNCKANGIHLAYRPKII